MKISLEQWRAFIAVVESGSYAAASEALHKSQSTLSYAVQKIEQLLGIKVFEVQGRKAVLTAAGQVLYRRGLNLLREAEDLETLGTKLAEGWPAELRLAVDVAFPPDILLGCLAEFGQQHSDMRIELWESVLSGAEDALLSGEVDLAISPVVPPGFLGDPIIHLEFVAAAAPSHPLHQLGRRLNVVDLKPHRHLIARDSGKQRRLSAAWLGERRWTVSHLSTSIHAAKLGLGYAWFPEAHIRAELASDELRPLPLEDGQRRSASLYLIRADQDRANPAALQFAASLKQCAAESAAKTS